MKLSNISQFQYREQGDVCQERGCNNKAGGGVSSVMREAHDSSLCGGSQGAASADAEEISPLRRRGGGFPIAPATPSVRIPCNLVVTQRWQVAAALSAAVTTTKQQEPAQTFRRNQLRRSNQLKRQPLFGREGSGGRGASLREAASPPSVPYPTSLREGARGRGLLYREVPSLAKHYLLCS